MTFLKNMYAEYALLSFVFFIGLGLTAASAISYQNHHENTVKIAFDDAANERIETIREFINYSVLMLESVNRLYQASSFVSREEFDTFTAPIINEYPYIHAIGWIPHIRKDQRSNFERTTRETIPSFIFTQKNEKGEYIEEPVYEDYYPLAYTQPSRDMAQGLGFDLARDPERSLVMEQAKNARQPQISGRITFLNQTDPTHNEGVILLAPVYKKHMPKTIESAPYEYLEGFVSSSISLYTLIEIALKPLQPQGLNIVIRDMTPLNKEDQILYVRSTRLKDIPHDEILAELDQNKTLSRSTILDIGGKKWQINALQATGFFSRDVAKGTYAISIGGLLFTTLLTFYMLSAANENKRINRKVKEQTEELSRAKHQTDLILLSTHEGIIGIDPDGKITFCNPRATGLLGFSKRELIGQDYYDTLKPYNSGKPTPQGSCNIRRVMEEGQTCSSNEQSFTSKSGNIFPVELTASPMMDGDKVSGAVLIFHDITERKKHEDNLQFMAQYDQLTGLCNRHHFMHSLDVAIERAKQTGKKVSVIYFDLNGFKKINDSMGHAAGDEMLINFSKRLKKCFREGDTAARLGGDEFVVLTENTDDNAACLQATDRLLTDFALHPVVIAGTPYHLSASIGIAIYPDTATDSESLIKHADAAMYKAKKEKNTKYEVYNDKTMASRG